MGFWRYINFDVIMVTVLILVALYFYFTSKKSPRVEYKNFMKKTSGYMRRLDYSPVAIESRYRNAIKDPSRPKKINKNEEKCREIFERLYRKRFISTRPDWLKNPITHKNLELDGFNDTIRTPLGVGLAFEYDGKQHAEYVSHFHRGGPEEFIYQTKKDSWKDAKCRQRGVFLVRIPHYVHYHDLERFIKRKLAENKILPQ